MKPVNAERLGLLTTIIPFLLLFFQDNTIAQDDVGEMRYYSPDMGHWLGLTWGVQTNGGKLSERWTAGGLYEWRYSKMFSLPFEVRVFRDRGHAYDEQGRYGPVFEHSVLLSGAWRIRQRVPSGDLFVQVGLESVAGSGFAILVPAYGVGAEIFVREKLLLSVSATKNVLPDYKHFIKIGLSIMFSSLTK